MKLNIVKIRKNVHIVGVMSTVGPIFCLGRIEQHIVQNRGRYTLVGLMSPFGLIYCGLLCPPRNIVLVDLDLRRR